MELFVRRARKVDPDDEAIPEICRRLDGLPLAIELAAARTRLLSPAAILERLGRRLELLTGGPRDAPERQRTLRAAIEWSHDLLEPDEQRLFAQLAVFEGGWSLEAAEAVAGDVLDELEALVDRSLVHRTGERFQLLESVHEFARERLDDDTRARHAAWALTVAEAAESGLEGAAQPDWLRRLDAERENLGAAAEHAIATGDAETAQRIAGALWRFWLARGAVAEGRRLVDAARAAGPASPAAGARAGNAAGVLAGAAGDHAAAREAFTAALAHAREAGDRAREARVVTNLGVLDVFAEDYDEAQARYEAAAAIWRDLGDVRGQSIVTQNLAIVHEGRGDLDRAADLLEQSVELARRAGDPAHVASTLHVLGSLLARRGESERAVPLVRESLELSHAAGESVLTRRVPGDAGRRRRPRRRGGHRRHPARGRRGAPRGRPAPSASPTSWPPSRRPCAPSSRRSGPTRWLSRSTAGAAPSCPPPSSWLWPLRVLDPDDHGDRDDDDRGARRSSRA